MGYLINNRKLIMENLKLNWIENFREEAERSLAATSSLKDRKEKAKKINIGIQEYRDDRIKTMLLQAKSLAWNNKQILDEILMITYTSYIVMLEYRNKIWSYDYMAFARRIGELWEPFCKLPFEYSIRRLKIIEPMNFRELQRKIKSQTTDYINTLRISEQEKRLLTYYYEFPWNLVDSGGIKLDLDLHFEQNGVHYNCDFKSGFSSNEKGNTNRLLLVGSIYHSISENEKTVLFVRQKENQNNHYLQTLKNSGFWSVYCADDCYTKILEFTGFDLRHWLDVNVDWESDISAEFRSYLNENGLLKYLSW